MSTGDEVKPKDSTKLKTIIRSAKVLAEHAGFLKELCDKFGFGEFSTSMRIAEDQAAKVAVSAEALLDQEKIPEVSENNA